jgi:hypothetical protein
MKWIKVSDQLPLQDQQVISTDGQLIASTIFQTSKIKNEYWWSFLSSGCGCCDTDMNNVSHWMPLPEKPE